MVGLVLVVAAAGLVGGGAAGAEPTTTAIRALAAGVWPGAAPAAVSVAPAPARPAAEPIVAVAAGPVAVPAGSVASVPVALPLAASVPAALPRQVVPRKAVPRKAAGTVPGTPCRSTAGACIDLSANRAWLIDEGAVQYGPVPITHGRKGFRTPPGTFRVSYKAADHVSSVYDAEMPYSVFFNGGIAFHQGSLKQLSHGCIHLAGKAARTFFGSLDRGEVVQVVR